MSGSGPRLSTVDIGRHRVLMRLHAVVGVFDGPALVYSRHHGVIACRRMPWTMLVYSRHDGPWQPRACLQRSCLQQLSTAVMMAQPSTAAPLPHLSPRPRAWHLITPHGLEYGMNPGSSLLCMTQEARHGSPRPLAPQFDRGCANLVKLNMELLLFQKALYMTGTYLFGAAVRFRTNAMWNLHP